MMELDPLDAELEARLRYTPPAKVGVFDWGLWERRRVDALARAFRHVARRQPFVGTATELLAALDRLPASFARVWPKGPKVLGIALRRAAPLLLAVGVEVAFAQSGSRKQRLLSVRRVAPS
jgi:hypothetical protein